MRCSICGGVVENNADTTCDGCWEVTHRLDSFLRSGPAAVERVVAALRKMGGAAGSGWRKTGMQVDDVFGGKERGRDILVKHDGAVLRMRPKGLRATVVEDWATVYALIRTYQAKKGTK